MVRRRSTVRFRNGAQIDGQIRKDSNGLWMPVGSNGCQQGAERPATAYSERRCPRRTWGTRSSRQDRGSPSPTADQSTGQLAPGSASTPSDRGTASIPESPAGPKDGEISATSSGGARSVPGVGEMTRLERVLAARADLARRLAGRCLVRRPLQGRYPGRGKLPDQSAFLHCGYGIGG